MNFTLEELLHSETAITHGFTEQFQPTSGIVKNLNLLMDRILQPLRDSFGKPITVNCGYRCPRVNQAVGGVPNSQHLEGKAADITSEDNKALFELAKSLPFDQLLSEKTKNGVPTWIHISYNNGANRKQIIYT